VADYASIREKFGIIYTCNCGWLDHPPMFPLQFQTIVPAPKGTLFDDWEPDPSPMVPS
jgi:hypothetical protein